MQLFGCAWRSADDQHTRDPLRQERW